MGKLSINIRRIWTFALVFYIICNAAFSYGELKMLNTLALYFFLGVSVLCVLLRRKVRFDFTVITLIVYAVIMFVGMLYTPTKESAVHSVIYDYVTMMILAVCVVQYIREVKDLETIMFAYMLAGLALAIYVYAQYGSEFWTILQENAENQNVNSVDRLGRDLTNVNTIGMVTAFSVVIGVYNLIYARTSKLKTVFCAALVIFCFIVCMAAASKKSLIIIFVSFVVMYIYNTLGSKDYLKQFRNLFLVIAGIAAVILLVMNLPIFSGIATRYQSLFSFLEGGSGTTSEIHRMQLISTGLDIWADHPLFGAGTYASGYYFGVYAHNNFVELLLNSGLVGLTVFYTVYLVAGCKYIGGCIRYKQSGKISIVLFAVLVSIAVCGMAFVYYYDRYYMILMATACSATGVLGKKQ